MGVNAVIRGAILVVGILLGLAGLGTLTLGPAMAASGLWLVAMGGFLILAVVLERSRYRSEAAERANDAIGPGGGETPGPVEPRFRPTPEVFVDPTTATRMRVLVDPRTGERRYVADTEA
ncbi:MAG TPA: hypothetical protein VH720_14415 [Candidatus Limnocylindrales bacterium]